jgi:hypothetical protein
MSLAFLNPEQNPEQKICYVMPKIKPYVQLLNGCYRTEIAVIPKNWKAKNASTGKEWII